MINGPIQCIRKKYIVSSLSDAKKSKFPALSIDPWVRISLYASYAIFFIIFLFLTYDIKDYYISFVISFIYDILWRITAFYERRPVFFVVEHK